MALPLAARRLTLTLHVTSSVGWFGAALAYLALAIVGLKSRNAQVVTAAYLTLELIGWLVIVPASLAALATGFVQSLGTDWGLLKHYWIVAKLALTAVATMVLMQHMRTVTYMSDVAANTLIGSGDFGKIRVQLIVHASGGLLVLFTATVLSIFKPWGKTPWQRRKRHEEPATPASRPQRFYVLIGVAGLFAIALLLHLLHGGGPTRH